MGRLIAGCLLIAFSSAASAQSPFAGAWRGIWTDQAGQHGSASIFIDPSGEITGTVANQSFSVVGPISGRAAYGGQTHLNYTYDGGRSYYSADGLMVRSNAQLVARLAIHTADGRSLGVDTFRFTGPPAPRRPAEFGPPGYAPAPPGRLLDPETSEESFPSPKQQ